MPGWRRAHAVSGVTVALILAYVERARGPEAARLMIADAGLAERERELRDEHGLMRADRHSDIPARMLAQLEQWVQRSRQDLRDGPIVIDDLAGVRSLEALAGDAELPLGSACASPLNFRGDLLGSADRALYDAKRAGRGRAAVAS